MTVDSKAEVVIGQPRRTAREVLRWRTRCQAAQSVDQGRERSQVGEAGGDALGRLGTLSNDAVTMTCEECGRAMAWRFQHRPDPAIAGSSEAARPPSVTPAAEASPLELAPVAPGIRRVRLRRIHHEPRRTG